MQDCFSFSICGMGSGQYQNHWSMNEVIPKEEDPLLSFPFQLPSLDSCSGWGSPMSWQYDLATQEGVLDATPLMMETFPNDDHLYSSFDHLSNSSIVQQVYEDEANLHQKQPFLRCGKNDGGCVIDEIHDEVETSKGIKRGRRSKEERANHTNSSRMLSRVTISQYFYMPITQAAKELNVGLTLLKKRCRELGIGRWPHRKLMSLQTLIKNIEEMGKEGGEWKVKGAIEMLEQEKKLMEEMPGMQLEDRTKRLRQACFKANYKKRKLMGPNSNSSDSHNHLAYATANDEEDDDDEIKFLLSDSFSSNANSLF